MIDELALPVPALPDSLDGLRIAHLSDIHARRPRRRFRQLAGQLQNLHVDLAFFTGDYMDDDGDEPAALAVMRDLCLAVRPRLGRFGVFGNHDSPGLPETFADLPVHWLDDRTISLEAEPIDVTGFAQDRDRWPDAVKAMAAVTRANGREHAIAAEPREGEAPAEPALVACHGRPGRAAVDVADVGGHGRDARGTNVPGSAGASPARDRLRLLLCHEPTFLGTAADLGVDIMFAGHTHGGQCRLPGRRALYNSTDMPLHLSAGVLRCGRTLCAVSRGVGETLLPLRTFCRAHVPVYTLRAGGEAGPEDGEVECVVPW